MNVLAGNVTAAANHAQGFDSDTALSCSQAQAFAQQGYDFCLRYLSLDAGQDPGDLSFGEAEAILAAGLGLMPVQHVISEDWFPTGELGTEYGTNAASNATEVGFPPGVNVWLDLEGVDPACSAADVIVYCQNWYAAVAEAGYVPGLYVGANCVLDGWQLYDLPFQHYWQSASTVPPLPARGYQMAQSLPLQFEVNGININIDIDIVSADSECGTPLYLAPDAQAFAC